MAIHQRRKALAELRQVVENRSSTEHDIRKKLVGQTWIFGGRYIEEAYRKVISPEDIVDIPLIRNDGAYHVVELKRAYVPNLITEPRSHPTVGSPVHEATMQAANYVRTLDEDVDRNQSRYSIDSRRSSATVLIGHTDFVDNYSPEEISVAVRTYNALVSRIQVLTYDELIKAAEHSLQLADHTERFEVRSGEEPPTP